VVSAASLTIRAFAAATGYQNSPIVVGTYQIQGAAATPTFTPASGTSFPSTLSISIADATPSASIYYTTDGSTPTTASQLYSAPFTVSATTTVNAIATASGYTQSAQGSASYTYSPSEPVTQTPTFSPAGGSYTTAQQVTISDATAGAVIYYTTNGTTPTTSSAVYSSPISVASGTVTINAIAQAPGDSASSVGSAIYTIQAATAATPTFSPVAGTYTSAQSVTIADTTPGATIYYTTNGTTPTTSSAVYSGAITVSASTTLEALAVASGYAQSAVATAAYVIQSSGTSTINFASGFPSATGLQMNGPATVSSSNFLELTNGGGYEASSAFWTTPVNIQSFTTNFTFQLTSAAADGFTFTIQDAGTTALGNLGGGLGYGVNPNGGTTGGIGKSVAVKFDIYSNAGEGNDSTGVFTDGAAPTNPAVNLTSSGIVLASGDTIAAQLVYNGAALTLTLSDTVTNKTFSQAFTVNIPSTVGASTAYVGFTGGTGGSTAIQNIKTWTFTSGTP
jgi:hypothetical protein